jgi:chemosensory pili system protein ChpA (sensor histidine kinase/response regulator)
MEPVIRNRRQRALLIDDDTSTLRDYSRELSDAGYEVTKASDPAVALGLARSSVPDVIFLRIGSRGTGSLSFLANLRADDMTRHVPVTMLSNRRNAMLEKAALMAVIERERS